MANFTSYTKETLQERLQREAKEKLGGVLLATGGTELDTIIAYTISETIKAGVSAIGGEHRCCLCEKPAPKDTPALSIEDFHPIVQSVFRHYEFLGQPVSLVQLANLLEEAVTLAIEKGKEEGLEWPRGTHVRKIKGSEWEGTVVGFYQTELTPEGYAVESERERGSVQIYPFSALEKV